MITKDAQCSLGEALKRIRRELLVLGGHCNRCDGIYNTTKDQFEKKQ